MALYIYRVGEEFFELETEENLTLSQLIGIIGLNAVLTHFEPTEEV